MKTKSKVAREAPYVKDRSENKRQEKLRQVLERRKRTKRQKRRDSYLKHFTMIELMAVMTISVFLVSIIVSISKPNKGNYVQGAIGSLIMKANTHCMLTGDDVLFNIVTSGNNRYFEAVIDDKSHRVDFEELRVETNVNTFIMNLKGCTPQDGEITIVIDGGLYIRINSFTNRVFYYKPKQEEN